MQHRTSRIITRVMLGLLLLCTIFLLADPAHAAISSTGVLNNVLDKYKVATVAWGAAITAKATWLFWTLAIISMVWTFGALLLRKADIGEFFAELFRYIMFTGFFLWLLQNGPTFAIGIMDSLRTIGGTATGTGPGLAPSGIVDIGFDIFYKVIDRSSALEPIDSLAAMIVALIILICLALVAVNMLLLLVTGWILAYAGAFFLGFGGSRWTSDMAVNYFKTVLSVAAQLMTMVLLVGIGKTFVDVYYKNMDASMKMEELAVMLVVAVVLLVLVNKVPPLIGQLPFGGGTGSGIGTAGAGTAMAVGTAVAAGMATAASMMSSVAANAAGGAQAVMAAFSKAAGAESGGASMATSLGGGSNVSASESTNQSAGSSGLAKAMGDDKPPRSGGSFDAKENGSSTSTTTAGTSNTSSGSASGHPFDSARGSHVDLSAQKSSAQKAPAEQGGPSSQNSNGLAAAVVSAGRIAAGTAANLAQGALSVANEKVDELKEKMMDRISDTPGGKIAAAIRASQEADANDGQKSGPTFEGNSLGKGHGEPVNATAEIAEFRDRKTI